MKKQQVKKHRQEKERLQEKITEQRKEIKKR